MSIVDEVYGAILRIEMGATERATNRDLADSHDNLYEWVRTECEAVYNRLRTQYPDDVAAIEFNMTLEIHNNFGGFQDSEITRFVAETLPFLRE